MSDEREATAVEAEKTEEKAAENSAEEKTE